MKLQTLLKEGNNQAFYELLFDALVLDRASSGGRLIVACSPIAFKARSLAWGAANRLLGHFVGLE